LVGAHLATTLDLQDTQNVTNWRSTPASEPYIELLKLIFKNMDKSKIPPGKIAFGKALFTDREYPGFAIPLILTHYRRFYDEGYNAHMGFVSNVKIHKLFEKMPLFVGTNHSQVLGFKDHRKFEWNGKTPFAGEKEVPFLALYSTDLREIYKDARRPIPKL
jgi:hypothetical protein